MLIEGPAAHVRSERAQPDWAVKGAIGAAINSTAQNELLATLALRERYRDEYWLKRDPILGDRLLWRAQAFRHTVHVLPGQTILELGCGAGLFTRRLLKVTRGENPVTAVTFNSRGASVSASERNVEVLEITEFPGPLAGRTFDCVVAMDLLDADDAADFLQIVHDLQGTTD